MRRFDACDIARFVQAGLWRERCSVAQHALPPSCLKLSPKHQSHLPFGALQIWLVDTWLAGLRGVHTA